MPSPHDASRPTLQQTQQAMRAALLAEGMEAVDGLAGHGLDAARDADALGIYRNTCLRVLTQALRLAYPAVQQLVGAEFFEAAARIYVSEQLPTCACLDDYGGEFAAFLQQFEPAASVPYLPEVAQLEWAINGALHAPDAAPARAPPDLAQLAGLDEAALARVRLVAHPSVTLLSLRYPTDRIWRAVLDQDERAMRAIDLEAPAGWVLVERDERAQGAVQVRRLDAASGALTARLLAGAPLAQALEAAQASDELPADSTRLTRVLADHLASGRFIECRSDDPEATATQKE